ncbi:thiol:disulfide interchange protein DsbD [Duganella sp. CF458]|uniref:protein-disulfide reductase DsbD n=1 Tax=Duganella sp. CF458 TaxID=1884368 RepID=UPI0008F08F67|nr:protein-disulfide reductase DsbD [Duganella sp. CF458]SFF78064.1 thiol:disulfide interchange protein DsbD [Duganella sp. CF458]
MKFLIQWLAAVLLASTLGGPALADDFLAPERAFDLRTELRADGQLALHWTIAPEYHLYRDRITLRSDGAVLPVLLPPGKRKYDENFGKEMETYANALALQLPWQGHPGATLTVGYQGCADAGLCYPPVERRYRIDPARQGVLEALPETSSAEVTSALGASAAQALAADDDNSLAQRTLQSGSAWRIGAAFLAFGLLLSFTPCVLPMVPILSSIIVGEAQVTRKRGLLLAAAYSLGMALVYTSLGVAAGLAGEGLAGALQKPWVLMTFGALLVALALSMFDVYQLQLPSALQSRLSNASGNLSGGRLAAVFTMGAVSALIVGPCVAGPLAGALLYISQTGNALVGAGALFAMACGMSVPLLLTGLSAGSLLPRAGAWMNHVKKVFGLLLIAVAIWMVNPVLPVTASMALWGAFAILCAVFLRVGEAVRQGAGAGAYATKALGLIMLLGGLFEMVGAASSGRDVLQPLAHLRGVGNGATIAAAGEGQAHDAKPRFTRVRNVADLDQALASAKKPVMLDFYADWCVSCKEMERLTFTDTRVQAALQDMHLLQADVTANSDEDRALMKRFSLFGPPGIVMFDAGGNEVRQARIIGYQPPEKFLRRLELAANNPERTTQ